VIFYAAASLALSLVLPHGQQRTARTLNDASDFDTTITAGAVHEYTVRLDSGESANVVFRQIGIDVVIDVVGPDGKTLSSVDSPNGRNGDEPVVVVARAPGSYLLRVRPIDNREPTGTYHVRVVALRDARATTAMLQARVQARDAAADWLRRRSSPFEPGGRPSAAFNAKFDSVAGRAQVLGLGEATHGSREFGDARLVLTQRAIERGGYRIVALEESADRMARLNDYIAGRAATPAEIVGGAWWIGRRTQRQLIPWLRDWNRRHPSDRVTLIGVDPQNFLLALPEVRDFLLRAYGDRRGIAATWSAIERELAAADSQAFVFGNSRVDTLVRRQLFELSGALRLDAPILRRLYGDSAYERSAAALNAFAEFADFNGGQSGGIVVKSRDWYMAAHILRALSQRPGAKAVYWAHNAHIAHPAGRPLESAPTGSILRRTLGCAYQAIAMTFGAGAFVAQRPNDPEDRLETDSLPPNIEESIERVMNTVSPSAGMSMWGCIDDTAAVPPWLARPQQMRWVGALWLRGSDPAQASRPTRLLHEYDGLLYLPRVTAEDIVRDRPSVPPRATFRGGSTSGVDFTPSRLFRRSLVPRAELPHVRQPSELGRATDIARTAEKGEIAFSHACIDR
jgi:erythromycin esterase